MVINDNRRGDREAFATTEEIEILVDNVVVPVDVAGIGISFVWSDPLLDFPVRWKRAKAKNPVD
jgi:hypothetical protein